MEVKEWKFLPCIILNCVVVVSYQPKECYSAGDCGPNECCLIGMQRYALPQCRQLGAVGDSCRVGAEPEDRTLFYPNSIFRFVEQSYALFCPCQPTLACVRNVCTAETFDEVEEEYN